MIPLKYGFGGGNDDILYYISLEIKILSRLY
jgi:hypothetical protein